MRLSRRGNRLTKQDKANRRMIAQETTTKAEILEALDVEERHYESLRLAQKKSGRLNQGHKINIRNDLRASWVRIQRYKSILASNQGDDGKN